MAVPGDPTIPAIVATRYAPRGLIGRGGMADVYRARDLRLERDVALKVLRPEYAADAEFLARFEREARIAAGLNHPHVVRVDDYGAWHDTFFIAMELLDAGDLKARVRREGRLAVDEAVRIAREVLSALGAAHAGGLVHRDVKPQNVLLTQDGTARLADFGIAHGAAEMNLTRPGGTIGTAAYLAPEQATGAAVGAAADIYGVGLLLYEMLTGRPPFDGESPAAVLYQHVHAPPPPLRERAPEVPPALEAIVARALAKSPADRYHSAAAMSAALAALPLDAMAVTAPLGTIGALERTAAWSPAAGAAMLGGAAGSSATAQAPPATAPDAAARRPIGESGGRLPIIPIVLALLAAAVVFALLSVLSRATGGTAGVAATTPTAAPRGPTAVSATRPAVVAPPTTTTAPPTRSPAPPTATPAPPTATSVPPTRTPVPPTPTRPPPTVTPQPPPPPAIQSDDKPGRGRGRDDRGKPATGITGQLVLEDTAFVGGYRNPGASLYRGRTATWVYGARSPFPAMAARFELAAAPSAPVIVTLVGLDSEDRGGTPMAILVNGRTIHSGPAPFESDSNKGDIEHGKAPWTERAWRVPASFFQAGVNTLEVRNLADTDVVGLPPFVMLDSASIRLEG